MKQRNFIKLGVAVIALFMLVILASCGEIAANTYVSGTVETNLYKADVDSRNVLGEKLTDKQSIAYGESYAVVFSFNLAVYETTSAVNERTLIKIIIDLKEFDNVEANDRLISEELLGTRRTYLSNSKYEIILSVQQANEFKDKEVYLFVQANPGFIGLPETKQIATYISSDYMNINLQNGSSFEESNRVGSVVTHDLKSIKGGYSLAQSDIVSVANTTKFNLEIKLPSNIGNVGFEFYADEELTERYGSAVIFGEAEGDYEEVFGNIYLKVASKDVVIDNKIFTKSYFENAVYDEGVQFYLKIIFYSNSLYYEYHTSKYMNLVY